MAMTLVADSEIIDLADGIYEGELPSVSMVEMPMVLLASAFPVKPPRAWFDNPRLAEVTPLVIESSGRVYGHIAGFRTDHIGMNGKVRAPHSRADYAFFATGTLECDDGQQVNVGQITLVGGHAPLEASVAEAVAHYDNTDSAMIDVAIGEDKHGIWVAGALRPEVDDLKLRRLRASGVSGDWRPINGNLELVAVCAVNVPGFPTPRARVAAGQPVALVAAGMTDIVEAVINRNGHNNADAVYASIAERLSFVEDALLGRVLDNRDVLLAAIEATGMDGLPVAESVDDIPDDGRAALRARVHGTTASVETVDVKALRNRVHPTRISQVKLETVDAPAEDPPVEEGVESAARSYSHYNDIPPKKKRRAGDALHGEMGRRADGSEPPDVDALRARVHGEGQTAAARNYIHYNDRPPEIRRKAGDALLAEMSRRSGGRRADGSGEEMDVGALRARVHGTTAAAPVDAVDVDALRARVHVDSEPVVARAFDAAARKTAAKKGQALPDGSFPIKNLSDLNNAIQALGRAADRGKALAHIRKRARELNAPKKVMDRLAKLKA